MRYGCMDPLTSWLDRREGKISPLSLLFLHGGEGRAFQFPSLDFFGNIIIIIMEKRVLIGIIESKESRR